MKGGVAMRKQKLDTGEKSNARIRRGGTKTTRTRSVKDPTYGLTAEECAKVDAFVRELFGVKPEQGTESGGSEALDGTNGLEVGAVPEGVNDLETETAVEVVDDLEMRTADEADVVQVVVNVVGSREAAIETLQGICEERARYKF